MGYEILNYNTSEAPRQVVENVEIRNRNYSDEDGVYEPV